MSKNYMPSDKVQYLAIPLRRLFVLTLVSGGLYTAYWLYKNWKAIKVADESNIRPFWRMFFAIIWVYPLFKRILISAQGQGYSKSYSPALLVAFYILVGTLYGVFTLLASSWPLLLAVFAYVVVTTLPLLIVQAAANFNNEKLGFVTASVRQTTANERAIIVIGFILTISSAVVLFMTPSLPETMRQIEGWGRLKAESDALLAQYDECADALNTRHKTLDTSDQVAVDAYNADVDACEDIRLRQNEAADKYQAAVGR
jgi:hypothetical protein